MKFEDWLTKLKVIPLFNELSDNETANIYKIAQYRIYKPKKYICMQGTPLTKIFILHSGKVKFFRSDSLGREQIMSFLEAGEMFPYVGFFRSGKHPATAKVIEEVHMTILPIYQFEKILLSNPEMCIKLFNILGEKIVDLHARLEEQILHNTYEQIILLFIRLCKSNGVKYGDYYKLTTHFTNRELAHMIGTSRETISRTVNLLKKKGFLRLDEDGYLILNPVHLQQEIIA
ncbi:Crp/Fnr family transcriptional regulator [Bacillus tuaregi]|uniref:Crp/Fnr family transcriptional regulator n=1 Tax=Bacillus tuaregi TaxID=1816695 RepID=UPI0008F8BA70|nr:Crp/Fnr family transcriptional regulator [Bacillus tuaregi]